MLPRLTALALQRHWHPDLQMTPTTSGSATLSLKVQVFLGQELTDVPYKRERLKIICERRQIIANLDNGPYHSWPCIVVSSVEHIGIVMHITVGIKWESPHYKQIRCHLVRIWLH